MSKTLEEENLRNGELKAYVQNRDRNVAIYTFTGPLLLRMQRCIQRKVHQHNFSPVRIVPTQRYWHFYSRFQLDCFTSGKTKTELAEKRDGPYWQTLKDSKSSSLE